MLKVLPIHRHTISSKRGVIIIHFQDILHKIAVTPTCSLLIENNDNDEVITHCLDIHQ